MLVLAEHPIKHPNYPNGDHYAVLDTDDGVVEYATIEEIQNYIADGITFIGNNSLAVKDVRKVNRDNKKILRQVSSNNYGEANLVYYKSNKKVVIEFIDTGFLSLVSYSRFIKGAIRDSYRSYRYGINFFILAENPTTNPCYINLETPYYMALNSLDNSISYLSEFDIVKLKSEGITFVGNNSLAIKDDTIKNINGDILK